MQLAAFLALLVVLGLLAMKFLNTHRIAVLPVIRESQAEEPKLRQMEVPTDNARRNLADLRRGLVAGIVVFLFVGWMEWVRWSTLLPMGLLGLISIAAEYSRLRGATSSSIPDGRSSQPPIVGIAVSVGLMIAVIIAFADDDHAPEVMWSVATMIGFCWVVRGLIRKRRRSRHADV